jgi:hypothetical protein
MTSCGDKTDLAIDSSYVDLSTMDTGRSGSFSKMEEAFGSVAPD